MNMVPFLWALLRALLWGLFFGPHCLTLARLIRWDGGLLKVGRDGAQRKGPKRGPWGPKEGAQRKGTIFIDGFPLIFIDGYPSMNINMDIQFFEIQFFEIQFFEIQFFEIQFFEIQFFEIQFFEIQFFEKTMKNNEKTHGKPCKNCEKQ